MLEETTDYRFFPCDGMGYTKICLLLQEFGKLFFSQKEISQNILVCCRFYAVFFH